MEKNKCTFLKQGRDRNVPVSVEVQCGYSGGDSDGEGEPFGEVGSEETSFWWSGGGGGGGCCDFFGFIVVVGGGVECYCVEDISTGGTGGGD